MSILLALAMSLIPLPDRAGEEFVPVDLAKIERSIRKEPNYVAQPRYGLFVLDPAGKVRVWAVFDKSKPDLTYYDTLYFDRNADGDLTQDGERISGMSKGISEDNDPFVVFQVGKFDVPGTSMVHRDIWFSGFTRAGKHGFGFGLAWNGKTRITAGYDQIGGGVCA